MYVEFMKNVFLADSSELMGVRLIFASWAQKRLFLLSWHDVRSVHEKLFLADTSKVLAVLPISASWAKKRLIPSFIDIMYVKFMRNFFWPIGANWWVLDSFRLPEPKNVSFLLSRHDVGRVHEKLFSRRYERAIGCFTNFGFLSPKTFDSYFIDIMSVEFMKDIFSPILASWCVLDSFRPPEPKNVWFLLYRHHVRGIHEKFFSRRFERTGGC